MQTHRLRKHADYQLVYKSGRKQFAKQMGYFYTLRPALGANGQPLCSDTTGPRVGLTVPKALGNAVMRNRIKRRMREAVRHALPQLTAPADVILHPRKTVLEMDFQHLQREVKTIFRSIQAALDKSQSKPTP